MLLFQYKLSTQGLSCFQHTRYYRSQVWGKKGSDPHCKHPDRQIGFKPQSFLMPASFVAANEPQSWY